jgi:hypothetical protein
MFLKGVDGEGDSVEKGEILGMKKPLNFEVCYNLIEPGFLGSGSIDFVSFTISEKAFSPPFRVF